MSSPLPWFAGTSFERLKKPKETYENEETDDADARSDLRLHDRCCDLRPGRPQEGRDEEDQEEGWQEKGRRTQEGRRLLVVVHPPSSRYAGRHQQCGVFVY